MNPKITIEVLSDITKTRNGLNQLKKMLDGLNRDYKRLSDLAKVAARERDQENRKEIESIKQKGRIALEQERATTKLKVESFREDNRRRREGERKDEQASRNTKKRISDEQKAKEQAERRSERAIEKRQRAEEKAAKQSLVGIQREVSAANKRIRQNETLIRQAKRRAEAERVARREALHALGFIGVGGLTNLGFAGENIIRGVVQGAVDIERSTDSFRALLGTANAAADAIQRIRNIAFLPGIDEGQARRALQQLIAYKFEIEEADLLTREFGNATALAGGGAHSLGEVLKQVGQASRRNKFEQQELNALVEYAPTIFQSYEKFLGETITSGEDFTKATIAMSGSVRQFIIDATKFATDNAPRAGIDTLANAASNLRNQISFAQQELGKQFIPEIRSVTNIISNLIDRFNSLNPQTKEWVGYLVAGTTVAAKFADPLLQIVSTISLLSIALGGAGGIIALLVKFGVVGLAVTPLVIYAKKLYDIKNAADDTKNAIEGITKAFSDISTVEAYNEALDQSLKTLRDLSNASKEDVERFKDLQDLGATRMLQPFQREDYQNLVTTQDQRGELIQLLRGTRITATTPTGRRQEAARHIETLKNAYRRLRESGVGANDERTLQIARQINALYDVSGTRPTGSTAPSPEFEVTVTAPTTRTRQNIVDRTPVAPQEIFDIDAEIKKEREVKRQADRIRQQRFESFQKQEEEKQRIYVSGLEFELDNERERLQNTLNNDAVSIEAKKEAINNFEIFLDGVNEARYFKDREGRMDLAEAELNDDKRRMAAAKEVSDYEQQVNTESTNTAIENYKRLALAIQQQNAQRKQEADKRKADRDKETADQIAAIDKVQRFLSESTLKHQAEVNARRHQWSTYFSYINQLNFESTEQFLTSLSAIGAAIARNIFLEQALRQASIGNIPGAIGFGVAALGAEASSQYIQREGSRSRASDLTRSRIFHTAQNDMILKRSVERVISPRRQEFQMAQIQRRNAQDATNIVTNALKTAGQTGSKDIVLNITMPVQVGDEIVDTMFEQHRQRVDLGLATA